MIRRILGFAVVAIVALLVLKIALGLLGVLIGLAVSLLVLAVMGYAFYLVLRVFSPSTAERIRQAIRGTPRNTP
jgi:O-antigen/teichoic acid export membrane protein